jgi:murein DD-endopeptidase MepM/ murein hydrolase activator NlpD
MKISKLYAALFAGTALVIGCSATPSETSEAAPTKTPPTKPGPAAKPAPPKSPAPVVADAVRAEFTLSKLPSQGAVILARAPSGAKSVTLNGNSVPVEADGYFLIGFDRDSENSASLVATLNNGKQVEKYLPVTPGNWKIENVNASMTGGAGTTAEFQRRRGGELAQINAARRANSKSSGWRQKFIMPATGRISGVFGSQRIYRGQPGSYHSGLDIAIPTGAPYTAPADGVVVLAATSPFTLEGNLLMIDHGMGLSSAFLHSSQLLVKVGDVVKQGQIIGKAGATGRASGPHLHWGMKWNNARVDPRLMVAG